MRRIAKICSYILLHRLKEHQQKETNYIEHKEENPTHEMDYENIQVIDRASSNFKMFISKNILILCIYIVFFLFS